jgi:predicted Fe-Mo cluster-binding NifX family protein
MKVAISSHDGKLDTSFSSRFGRCAYFVIIDSESRDWESKRNPAADARGGAGPRVVQFLSEQGVDATITSRYGPNAFTALEAARIQAFEADDGTPEQLIEKFLAGELKHVHAAPGPERH